MSTRGAPLELCAFTLKGEHNVYSLVPNIPVCIQDTRYKKFISQSNDMYIIMYKCITDYYYDYNGNGRSTITYIGCLPDAPGKVIRYIKKIKWTK